VLDMSEMARGVAEAQRLLMKKDLAGAETQLQQLVARYPHVSVAHDLLGNVYYLKKENAKALKAYKRSLELWPHNPETKGMVETLEKIVGNNVQGG
jgi:cytochrome c-type biogenesis protein CcmH/NrfG